MASPPQDELASQPEATTGLVSDTVDLVLRSGNATVFVYPHAGPRGTTANIGPVSAGALWGFGAPPLGQGFLTDGVTVELRDASGNLIPFFHNTVAICFPELGGYRVINHWNTELGRWVPFPTPNVGGDRCTRTRLPGTYALIGQENPSAPPPGATSAMVSPMNDVRLETHNATVFVRPLAGDPGSSAHIAMVPNASVRNLAASFIGRGAGAYVTNFASVMFETGTATVFVRPDAGPPGSHADAVPVSQGALAGIGPAPRGEFFLSGGAAVSIKDPSGAPINFFHRPVAVCFDPPAFGNNWIGHWNAQLGRWVWFFSELIEGQRCTRTRLPGTYALIGNVPGQELRSGVRSSSLKFISDGVNVELRDPAGNSMPFFRGSVAVCFNAPTDRISVVKHWNESLGRWVPFRSPRIADQKCAQTRLPGTYALGDGR